MEIERRPKGISLLKGCSQTNFNFSHRQSDASGFKDSSRSMFPFFFPRASIGVIKEDFETMVSHLLSGDDPLDVEDSDLKSCFKSVFHPKTSRKPAKLLITLIDWMTAGLSN